MSENLERRADRAAVPPAPPAGRSAPLGRPRYGVDAPPFPAVLGLAGAVCVLAAARWRTGRIATATIGTVLLAQSGCFLHTTLWGKHRIWEHELDRLGLAGDEQLLDLGCGRGAVLIEAARRLPQGRAVGADLWTKDQSGNGADATLANAAAAGVADRVEVHTADMTSLPFADASFDVVTSALAIHNIAAQEDRHRALDEAMRVLRPGGQLLIADITFQAKRYASHLGQGSLRGLGVGYWYGGPWFSVTMLHAVKDPLEPCTRPGGRPVASDG
jgi:SAM-dependent methyltransferase